MEQRLHRDYSVTTNPTDLPLGRDLLAGALHDYDALCPTITDTIDAALLGDAAMQVRIIANFGAGHEHIDLDAARRAGLVVTNTPDALTDATAELAILLMLMAARRAGEGEREVRAGRWKGWRPTHLLGRDLSGRTLGLVGFGRIAQAVARRAGAGFGMKILYHSRSRAPASAETALAARHVASLDALVSEADFVSLHVPGGPATRHLVNARLLALMKPTAILVNTARGSVVDEAALVAALGEARLAGAGLDVFAQEPAVYPKLIGLQNVVLLPHLGSATIETRTAMGMQAADSLDAFFAGREPRNRVA